jgi:Carboxypeptidase regulatory-like domain/Putative zinc-finger
MSELLQHGQHPDADQLNAFVEHALSPHEQEQTLAHLAICPDCRSIVALSQPVEEVPELESEPVRKPWFLGWNLVWPAAAALTGVVLFFLHVHNVANTGSSATAPNQMAESRQPTPLSSPVASTAPVPGAASSRASEVQARGTAARAAAAGHVANQKAEGVINGRNIATLPVQSRNLAGLKGQSTTSIGTAEIPPPPSSTTNGASGLSKGSAAALSQAFAGNRVDRLQQSASGAAPVNAAADRFAAVAPAAAPAMARQAQAKPVPPTQAVAPAPVATADQSVEASGVAQVATLSSMSNRLLYERPTSVLARHPLPSRLPALSVVSAGHQTLAIDTQNTLFFSGDDGEHWKTVPSAWRGLAVKVDLIPAANAVGRGAGFATGKPQAAATPGAIREPVFAAQVKAPDAALRGTVTDATGAVIRDASIVVSDAATPNLRTVKTDSAGHYVVDGLVPGNYRVEADAPGFSAQQLAVNLVASQQSVANLSLQVGQSAETVTVSAEAAAVPLETTSLAKKKAPEAVSVASQPHPLFELTTDSGERWMSTDGQAWKRR